MPEIRNLSFSYDGTPVFSGLCLSLPDGSRTALLAPRVRQDHPAPAALRQSYPPERQHTGLPAEGIAMVFQEDRLLPGCTVLENLRLVAPERPDTELIALLGELGLSGWENARPGKLSGGMRRRAAIARALVFHSPAGHHGRAVQGAGRSHPGSDPCLCGPLGLGDRTFLLVTHSPQEAERPGLPDTRLDELTRTGSEKQN